MTGFSRDIYGPLPLHRRLAAWVSGQCWQLTHRYCTACDEIHRPWTAGHRSCRCGISKPDTWTDTDRDAFQDVITAALALMEKEEREP